MVLVFSKKITHRLKYITGLIFRDILGTGSEVTSDPVRFARAEGPRICYSDTPISGSLFLKASQLLFETGILPADPSPIAWKGETGFFETSPGSLLPFDPFASAFLVVSRMEEYLPGPRDRFGRFPATASLLYRHGLQEKAVVNRWAILLAAEIEKQFVNFRFPERKFSSLLTIDIDNAWAYRHKGIFRTSGGLVKDLLKGNFRNFRERLAVVTGVKEDPFNTYDYLRQVLTSHESDTIFFFLTGDYAKYDKQVSRKNRHFRRLIADTGKQFQTGIHPSFLSSEPGQQKRLIMEKERLENMLGKTVNQSRQHYLRIRLPETYRHLIDAGITEDYSMGYPDLPGFRAGICTPFHFYDLSRETETSLKIFPFQMMEMTFSQYLNKIPSEALRMMKSLLEEVKAVNGTFISVWHNESLATNREEGGFRPVFEALVSSAFRYADRI